MSSNEKLSAHTQARKPWLHDILHVFSIVVSRYVVNIAVETAMQLGGGERERERDHQMRSLVLLLGKPWLHDYYLLVLSRVHIVSRAIVSVVVETVPSSGNLGSVTITTIMMN